MWNNFCRNTAIYILDKLGVEQLTEERIALVEDILGSTFLLKSIHLNKALSANEKACLLLLAHGRSKQEISELIKVKVKTVTSYQNRITHKLGYKNVMQAIFSEYLVQSDMLEQCLR